MSRVQFKRYPFENLGFPRPWASMLPHVTPALVGRALVGRPRTMAFAGGQFFVRARYALQAAFRAFGVRAACDRVLLPAYHCRTMVEPVIRAGGTPWFYRVNGDLSVDVDHMAELIAAEPDTIRCAVVPHFFGCRQAVDTIRELLDAHGIPLIEDCAHVLAPDDDREGIGCHGALSIFSPSKLLACPDGGVLFQPVGDTGETVQAPSGGRGWTFELRLLVRRVKADLRLRRQQRDTHRFTDAPAGNDDASIDGSVSCRAVDTDTLAQNHSPFYQLPDEDKRASFWSRRLIARSDLATIRKRRRDHFRWWVEVVDDLPSCRPLFRELEAGMAPYVFPLVLDEPAAHFDRLKLAGVPLYRWDELALSDCRNAAYFREHLVQLPCHQDLESAQRVRLLNALQRVLSTNGSGRESP